MMSTLLLLLLLQAAPVQPPAPVDTIGVPQPFANGWYKAKMDDGLYMSAKVDKSAPKNQGLMICLPMMGHTAESFDPLVSSYVKEVDAVKRPWAKRWIRLDLRGHGKSVVRGKGDTLSYRTMPTAEFLKYPRDVQQVLQGFVSGQGLTDTSDITIIGASIGANTAALLTDSLSYIKRLVLLSPGKNYHGLEPAEAIKKFKGQILLVATKGDTYSYEAVKYFHDLNPEHSTLLVYEGDAHATDILDTNPQAMKDVVDWLLKK